MDTRKKTSGDTKRVARHAISTFGSPPNVWRFTCESEGLSIDVGGCPDRPTTGVTSYSTIGLSDYEITVVAEGLPRVELAGACTSDRQLFPNVLAGAAMMLIRQARPVKAGEVIRDVVAEFYPRTTTPHLYLTRPFPWNDRLALLECETRKVAWLLAVPAAQSELDFLAGHGDECLEQFFRQSRVNMYSLIRPTWTG